MRGIADSTIISVPSNLKWEVLLYVVGKHNTWRASGKGVCPLQAEYYTHFSSHFSSHVLSKELIWPPKTLGKKTPFVKKCHTYLGRNVENFDEKGGSINSTPPRV